MSATTTPTEHAAWARKHPCAKCPFRAEFRGESDYLRPGRRREIVRALLTGQSGFPCHETVTHAEDDDGEPICVNRRAERECAGVLLVLHREGASTQMSRISERLGSFDPDEFVAAHAGVALWTLDECTADGLPDDDQEEEGDACNTVGPTCLAPAGYLEGGVAVASGLVADGECPNCGEAVCSECADENGLCGRCAEEEDDPDDR